MKAWIVAAASVVLGLGGGLAAARWQYGNVSDVGSSAATPKETSPEARALPDQPEGTPTVEVDQKTFEFGKMEHDSKMTHAFKFKNVGTAPLKLTKGQTTCKCTLSNLDVNMVPPGGTAIVSLEWRAESGPGPFRQTAAIMTNDPTQPVIDLAVEGEIVQSVSFIPASLALSSISATDVTQAEVGIYAFHRNAFELRSFNMLPTDTAQFFEVSWVPATPQQLTEHQATAGYIVKVTVKPGLPLGLVKQRISIASDLPDAPTLEIPVEGTVTSDISVVGQDWSVSLGLLKLGRVTNNEETKRSLKLLTRGQHRQNVEFKVLSVDPDVLQVKIGERTEINKGQVTAVPLDITIPNGSRQVNCLGAQSGKYGEIWLETNHPDVKKVRVQVMFAVEGN